jgi:hypothetical protein
MLEEVRVACIKKGAIRWWRLAYEEHPDLLGSVLVTQLTCCGHYPLILTVKGNGKVGVTI